MTNTYDAAIEIRDAINQLTAAVNRQTTNQLRIGRIFALYMAGQSKDKYLSEQFMQVSKDLSDIVRAMEK